MQTIEEIVSKAVDRVINEELGINEAVYKAYTELLSCVNNNIADKKQYHNYYINGIKVHGITAQDDFIVFGDMPVKLQIQFYFVRNENHRKRLIDKIFEPYSFYFVGGGSNLIFLRAPVIRELGFKFWDRKIIFDPEGKIKGSLIHELKHAYQQYMMDKKHPYFDNDLVKHKHRDLYNYALSRTVSWEVDDSDINRIYWAIYHLTPAELTANLESSYLRIKNEASDYSRAMQVLKNTPLYLMFNYHTETFNKLMDDNIDESAFDDLYENTGKDKKWFISFMKKGMKVLKKTISKLMGLISRDYQTNKVTKNDIDNISNKRKMDGGDATIRYGR